MADPKGFESLKAFLESVSSTTYAAASARAGSKVAHKDALAEMKRHILKLYDGTEAPHSFMEEGGAIYDCIPIEQQPALKGSKERVPKAPDAPPAEPAGPHAVGGPHQEWKEHLIASPLGPDKKDQYGNLMHCPPGTIPIRRLTLEDLSRFPTLKDFFRKAPRGAGRPPRAIEPPTVPATHRWAHAFQNVNNGGGHSYLSLWDPPIGPNQIFSLSQHWYVGGSGANLQTVECGWQVYPGRLGDARCHLFTYFTADDYNTTGCYDLTCSAFVQTSSTFAPGMVLGPISVVGGPQYIVELAYWHTGGRWWLYFNGTSGSNAIGYYPDTLFKGGALTSHATEIDYGGEVVGTTSFPPMGSGHFAIEGWQKAAYQRTIGYWTPLGGSMINASLTPSQGWPSCYTAQVVKYGAPWFETLWYGGPGGTC
ncbi:MAG TPA: neprosin family prolyl endopeptidase [Syntrophobacteria bacterium]|nr:neprosin family prolyl endopeptidase [Syntrophobacteria bacterium]